MSDEGMASWCSLSVAGIRVGLVRILSKEGLRVFELL